MHFLNPWWMVPQVALGALPNQPPVLGTAPELTPLQNTPANPDTFKFSLMAFYPDGDLLTVKAVSPSSTPNGTVTLTNGAIFYLPPVEYVGTDSFTYQVTGGFDPVTARAVNYTLNCLSPPNSLPGDAIPLKLIGALGVTYQLQCTSNFITSTTVAIQRPRPNGWLTFVDSNPPVGFGLYRTPVSPS